MVVISINSKLLFLFCLHNQMCDTNAHFNNQNSVTAMRGLPCDVWRSDAKMGPVTSSHIPKDDLASHTAPRYAVFHTGFWAPHRRILPPVLVPRNRN